MTSHTEARNTEARTARSSGLAGALLWLVAIALAVAGALLPTPWWQLGIVIIAVAGVAAARRLRAPAFRLGLWAALLFLGLRLVYRILFASALPPGPSETVLLQLPQISLGGPFSGIALLGPLTLTGAVTALTDATRFAVVFIVFGAVNALVDARTLLARAPRPLLPIATTLSLALGTVPALLAGAHRVARAAQFRGERRGPRLLVPVLEQAVERAGQLGASMELRGYGGASRPPGDTPANHPLAQVRGISVRFADSEVLRGVDLTLMPGTLTVLTGSTGSGKSTLLHTIAGLLPAYTGGEVHASEFAGGHPARVGGGTTWAEVAGIAVALPETRPADVAGLVAFVPQRPSHSFLAETVTAEISFALQQQRHLPLHRAADQPDLAGGTNVAGDINNAADAGADADDRAEQRGESELDRLVTRAMRAFGLYDLADRDPATLSAGESMRTALAAATVTGSPIVLLDEPFADLDPASTDLLCHALQTLVRQGSAVLVTEHHPGLLSNLAERVPTQWLRLSGGRITTGEAPRSSIGEPLVSGQRRVVDQGLQSIETCSAGDPLWALGEHLIVARGGRTLLSIPRLAVRRDAVTVVAGPNGSGKTSLFEDLALADPRRRLVPQHVDDLLIRDTLADEFRYADRRARAPRGTARAWWERLLADSIPAGQRDELTRTHPRDLSAGTRLALGIAIQVTAQPELLMLDEPTRGLDRFARHRLAEVLVRLAADPGGPVVLLSTHDAGFAELLTATGGGALSVDVLHVRNGGLE